MRERVRLQILPQFLLLFCANIQTNFHLPAFTTPLLHQSFSFSFSNWTVSPSLSSLIFLTFTYCHTVTIITVLISENWRTCNSFSPRCFSSDYSIIDINSIHRMVLLPVCAYISLIVSLTWVEHAHASSGHGSVLTCQWGLTTLNLSRISSSQPFRHRSLSPYACVNVTISSFVSVVLLLFFSVSLKSHEAAVLSSEMKAKRERSAVQLNQIVC